MFAEIADKMPPLETVWIFWLAIGLVVAVITTALSFTRLWIGGIAVAMSFTLGLLAAWPDIFDDEIIKELGVGNLWQQRISGFIPFIFAVTTWVVARIFRRLNN